MMRIVKRIQKFPVQYMKRNQQKEEKHLEATLAKLLRKEAKWRKWNCKH